VSVSPKKSKWPLYFIDFNHPAQPGVAPPPSISLDQWHVDNAAELVASNNGGVLYRGQELVHHRPPLPEGLEIVQIVLAWRVANERSCNGGG